MNRSKLKQAVVAARMAAEQAKRNAERAVARMIRAAAAARRWAIKAKAATRREERALALYRDSWRRTAPPPADKEHAD